MNKKIPQEFWAIALMYVGVLMVLSILAAFDKLSPQAFAVLVVVSLVFPFLRYWKLFQRAAKDTSELEAAHLPSAYQYKEKDRIRSSKIRIALVTVFACFAMWETRSGPLAPRLVGLAFLLFLLMGNIRVLRQARKRLMQLNSGE